MHTRTAMAAAYGGGGSLVALSVDVRRGHEAGLVAAAHIRSAHAAGARALLHSGDWRKVCARRS
jgi:hypothetical protein